MQWLKKQTQKRFIKTRFEVASGDDRKTWKIINQLIKNDFTCQKSKKLEYLLVDNQKISDDLEMANKLNDYFIDVGYNIGKEVQMEKTKKDHQKDLMYEEQHCPKTIYWKPCTQEEVKSICGTLKNHSAPGVDNITTKDIKNSLEGLVPVLTKLINRVLETGIYPEELKEAVVTQIHKKGAQHDPGNKRPLSVINAFSKILEKAMKSRLIDFVSKTFQFDRNQFGFQAASSTLMAATEVMEFITDNLDKQNYVLAVFVDLKKAFDTVDIKILLNKLYQMGIRGSAYSLMKTYLCDRKQSTIVNGVRSSVKQTRSGVPQGSVLGPVLYLLYVHSLSLVRMKAKYVAFADDTVLLYTHEDLNMLEKIVNDDLEIYYNWLLHNNLKMNTKKTVFMLFSKRGKRDQHVDVRINDQSINRVTDYRYLGLKIDNQLNYIEHINDIRKKLASLSGVLGRCGRFLSNKTKMMVYAAMVESHLRYMIPIWSAATKTAIQKIQVAQNRVLKRLHGYHWSYSTKLLYGGLRTLKVENIRKLEEVKLVHRIVHNEIKTNIKLQTNSDVHNYTTRQQQQLIIPRARTNIRKNSVILRSIRTFNLIPVNITDKNYLRLNSELKKYLISGQTDN